MPSSSSVESAAMRGHNQGSISKRKDGRLQVAVTMPNGRRRYAMLPKGATRAEARERLDDLLAARDARSDLSPDSLLGPFLRRWLDETRPSVRPSTFRHYELIVRVHLEPALGRHRLSALSVPTVQQYLRDAGGRVSPQTVRHHRAVLRRSLNVALRWGLVRRNVAALTDPPRLPAREPTVLTAAQVGHLLRSTNADRLHALWALAVTTGLRQAELLGLTWPDLDLDAGTVTVRRTLTRRNGVFEFVEPKTKRSSRTVPLPAGAIATMRAHRARQHQERLASGHGGPYEGLVFVTGGPRVKVPGLPLHASEVIKAYRRALAAAGLPVESRFHDLRHATASILVAQGIHPRVVMELLGHSTIGITMDRYSHVVSSLSREAMDKLGEAIG